MKVTFTLSSLLLAAAACGDDQSATPDASTSADAAEQTDAPIDAPSGFVTPTPIVIPLSAGGPDQIMSVAAGPSGSFYAAGYAATTPTGPKYIVVAKLTSAGALDPGFGTNGVYTSTVEFRGAGGSGTDEIDIVVQSTGKIVVAATVANDTVADDRDIGLIRVTTTGGLDTTFGSLGFSRINLSTGASGGTVARDSQRALALGPSDTLFLSAVSRDPVDDASTPRTDTDFTIAKLDADGDLDGTYAGGDGKFLLDFPGANSKIDATPRGLHVFSDGSVLAAGYANTPAAGNTTQAVLYRLEADGTLDTDFASVGFFHEQVLPIQTEVYNFGVEGTTVTTAGYGRSMNMQGSTNCCNDWISMRFNATTGARDMTFGGTTTGVKSVDPSGMMLGSNCRNAVALPGGKTALIGSAGPGGARDAAVAILTASGQLDTSFGTGVHKFQLDGAEDQFWGGAVSGGKLLVAGWKGVAAQTDTANDNSYVVLYTLQ